MPLMCHVGVPERLDRGHAGVEAVLVVDLQDVGLVDPDVGAVVVVQRIAVGHVVLMVSFHQAGHDQEGGFAMVAIPNFLLAHAAAAVGDRPQQLHRWNSRVATMSWSISPTRCAGPRRRG